MGNLAITQQHAMFRLLIALALFASAFTPTGVARLQTVKATSEVQMNWRKALAPAAALVVAGSAGAAFAGDAENGEGVFAGNCAACHAGGQNAVQPEKTLELSSLKSYLAGFDGTEKAIVYQVTNGKNAMPAFGGRLDDEEIEDVASYVLSQANGGW